MNEIMNLDEVAEFLKVSERTVTREVKAGKLKAFKVGRAVKFRRDDVEAYIRNQEVQPGQDIKDAA